MLTLVKVVGVLIVALGIAILVDPKIFKRFISFWQDEKKLYAGGVLSIVIGLIFITNASLCIKPWIITLMGIIALIKGPVLFLLGPAKVKKIISGYANKPPKTVRALAILYLVFGFLVIWSA